MDLVTSTISFARTSPSFRILSIYFISNHLSTTYKAQELTPVHRNTINTKLTQNIMKMFVVEFPFWFTLFSYAAPLQRLPLHSSSAVPA